MPEYNWTTGNPALNLPARPVGAAPPGPGLRAAAGRVDVTPSLGVPLSGYGPQTPYAEAVWGRNYATVLVIDDGLGHRTAIVALDLHCGSRYVTHRVASLLDPALGLGVEHLLVGGAHCHSGPGHFYGDEFYDTMTAKRHGFNQPWVEWLCERIAGMIADTCARLVAARLGFGTAMLDQLVWNRSAGAALANFGPVPEDPGQQYAHAIAYWRAVNGSAATPPFNLNNPTDSIERTATDSRLRVLWAIDGAGKPLGGIGLLSATPTVLHRNKATLSPDVTGAAARHVRGKLRAMYGLDVPVGITGASMGDANIVTPTMAGAAFAKWRADATVEQNTCVAGDLGIRLGDTLLTAIAAAQHEAEAHDPTDFSLTVRYKEVAFADQPVRHYTRGLVGPYLPDPAGNLEPRVASKAEFSRATLAGSSFAGTNDPFFKQPDPHYDSPRDSQWPKFSVGRLLEAVEHHIAGDPAPFMQLRLVTLGDVITLIGFGGEPSGFYGREVEKAVGEILAGPVALMGLAGGYVGYFTTPDEYMTQHYEGGSMWWGRMSGIYLRERLRELADGPTSYATDALFPTPIRPIKPDFDQTYGLSHPDNDDVWVKYEGGILSGQWVVPPRTEVDGYLADRTLVQLVDADGVPLQIDGQAATDVTAGLVVQRIARALSGFLRYRWWMTTPVPPTWSGRSVGFEVVAPELQPPADYPRWNPITLP